MYTGFCSVHRHTQLTHSDWVSVCGSGRNAWKSLVSKKGFFGFKRIAESRNINIHGVCIYTYIDR